MDRHPNHESVIERCKAGAASMAVEENITGDCVVGIGSGSTMTYVLETLVRRCKQNDISVKCIPTSFQSRQLIYDYNLPLTELDMDPVIDVAIDGADEMDENFVAIKGGGACQLQEKLVASAAKKFIVVADYRKDSKHLGQNWDRGIPIEVLPIAVRFVRREIVRICGARLEDLVTRIAKEKAGPVITDNGNLIIDWKFDYQTLGCSSSAHWKALSDKIKLIPGVLETGVFTNIIKVAYFGQPNGSVLKRTSELSS